MKALKVFFQQVGIFYKKFGVLPFLFLLALAALTILWFRVEPLKTAVTLAVLGFVAYLVCLEWAKMSKVFTWALVIGCAAVPVVALLAGLLDVSLYAASPKYYYAFRYNIPSERVEFQNKPHDCEWVKSPLGNKYCHYDKKVVTVRWATSTAGFPIVSYDKGKTWEVFTPDSQDVVPKRSTVVAVNVSWDKVDE